MIYHSDRLLKWDDMKSLPQFETLLKVLDEEHLVAFRQILSHHTSTPCQPGKAKGPVPSLKSCGIDTRLGDAGHWRLTLNMPHSYEEGDDLNVDFVGGEHTSFKACQADAAKTVLAFLLVNRPLAVHLHANTVRDIEKVRNAAMEVALALGSTGVWELPRDRPEAIRSELAFGSPTELTSDAEAELQTFLAELPEGTYDPTNAPPLIWRTFARLVPRGELKPVLQRFPNLVEVMEVKGTAKWTFRTSGTPHGAGAASSSGSALPAIGGSTPGGTGQTFYAPAAVGPAASVAPPPPPPPPGPPPSAIGSTPPLAIGSTHGIPAGPVAYCLNLTK